MAFRFPLFSSLSTYDARTGNNRQQEKHDENEKQHTGHSGRTGGNVGKPEHCRHYSDQEKN